MKGKRKQVRGERERERGGKGSEGTEGGQGEGVGREEGGKDRCVVLRVANANNVAGSISRRKVISLLRRLIEIPR